MFGACEEAEFSATVDAEGVGGDLFSSFAELAELKVHYHLKTDMILGDFGTVLDVKTTPHSETIRIQLLGGKDAVNGHSHGAVLDGSWDLYYQGDDEDRYGFTFVPQAPIDTCQPASCQDHHLDLLPFIDELVGMGYIASDSSLESVTIGQTVSVPCSYNDDDDEEEEEG